MKTHREIIADHGERELAALCGVSVHTVRSWKQRGKIPGKYWAPLSRGGKASLSELADVASAGRRGQ